MPSHNCSLSSTRQNCACAVDLVCSSLSLRSREPRSAHSTADPYDRQGRQRVCGPARSAKSSKTTLDKALSEVERGDGAIILSSSTFHQTVFISILYINAAVNPCDREVDSGGIHFHNSKGSNWPAWHPEEPESRWHPTWEPAGRIIYFILNIIHLAFAVTVFRLQLLGLWILIHRIGFSVTKLWFLNLYSP